MLSRQQVSAMFRFEAKLCRPVTAKEDAPWLFLVLPKEASDTLPRRGRTTVMGKINGRPFQATLEPDGKLSHWLKIDKALGDAAGLNAGDVVTLEISPVTPEPEPQMPPDLDNALAASPAAQAAWDDTTTIARVDWVHWIDSAKREETRARRIHSACDMLASGKGRVCCFDPSGFYSKGFGAPKEVK
jgi:hypothetical protein